MTASADQSPSLLLGDRPMATATKTAPAVFHRQSFTQRLIFTSRPDRSTRLALRAAGFRWNPAGYWWANTNSTAPLKQKELAALLAPVAANDNEPDSNDVIA